MVKWLKFIGLSFFSDKISKQAVKRGYLNLVFGLFFTLAFLFCGVLAADLLPFPTQYDNAEEFSSFVRNAFSDESLNVTAENKKIRADRTVNSFSNEADAAFRVNGYNFVADTRAADAFDDFEAYYLSNDGKEQTITIEEYASLSDVAKRGFDFKIRYTANELILTDELCSEHEEYLESVKNESYAELLKKQGELSREEYRKQVYNLYVKAYYPDLSAYESTGSAPLLRNYYYHNYLYDGAEKYLFIFDDSCVGSFKTDSGLKVTFYGFYKNFADGETFSTADMADSFIKNAFRATAPLSVYVYFMNLIRLLPFVILMPAALALLAFCVLKISRSEACNTFGGCLKIIGSYLLVGSFISALITFVCGYFLPRNTLIVAGLLTLFITLLIRTAVLLAVEVIAVKRVKPEPQNIETEN